MPAKDELSAALCSIHFLPLMHTLFGLCYVASPQASGSCNALTVPPNQVQYWVAPADSPIFLTMGLLHRRYFPHDVYLLHRFSLASLSWALAAQLIMHVLALSL